MNMGTVVIRTSEELISVFECIICTNLFETPKNLPNCGHTYCLKCLEALPKITTIRGRFIACPECRVASPVGPQGISAYQTNISAQRMVDSMRSQLLKQNNSNRVPLTKSTSLANDSDYFSAADNYYGSEGCPHAANDRISFECPHCRGRFCQACQISHMERLKIEIRNISGKFDQRVVKATENVSGRTKQITECYSAAVDKACTQINASASELIQVMTALIQGKAESLVKEARQSATEQLEGVRKAVETCQQRRVRLRQNVEHLMSTSVLKLTLQDIAKLHHDVMTRDSQIKTVEMINQGHLTNIVFRGGPDELAKFVASFDGMQLGSIQTQAAVHRFSNPTRLRQSKSCFNVSLGEVDSNNLACGGNDSQHKTSANNSIGEDEEQADDEDESGISVENNVFANVLVIQKDEIRFHSICGVNAKISANCIRASKNVNEFTKSVCFTNRPVKPGERVQVSCLFVDDTCIGGSALGFTSLDPALIPEKYPDLLNEDCLINGGSHFYWVTSDALSENGTFATFSYNEQGDTFLERGEKNSPETPPSTTPGEDTVPGVILTSSNGKRQPLLWGVVNLFGATSCVRINLN